ncbi:MAG: DUF3276 family protein [Brumimicrobium sp.]
MSEENNYEKHEVHSNAVRAGKRTYFFDVKSTRGNDLYLTITESKKTIRDDGKVNYQKHKIFLYKEDFEKFSDAFKEAVEKIDELKQNGEYPNIDNRFSKEDYSSSVNFEDLD